jgi:hypothetical protein
MSKSTHIKIILIIQLVSIITIAYAQPGFDEDATDTPINSPGLSMIITAIAYVYYRYSKGESKNEN